MNESYPWFGVAKGAQLAQGELFSPCPYLQVDAAGEVIRSEYDVVILSQSCDLANDKLDIVQVCPYWPLDALAANVAFLQTRKGKEELRRGNLPGYHLLNRCELPGLETNFLVVDFRTVFGVKLASLKGLAAERSPRPCLLPPYREHLAQAFARFFMRVGLPVDIPAF